MEFVDVMPPRVARASLISPKGRILFIALLAACLAAGAAQAGFDRPETVSAGCVSPTDSKSLLWRGNCIVNKKLSVFPDAEFEPAAIGIRPTVARSNNRAASLSRLDLAAAPPALFRAASSPLPPEISVNEPEAEPAPTMIVGAASMYNPTGSDDEDAGAIETASGENYDPEGWTAAIQIGLRRHFKGVRYRMKYEPAYALVEVGDRRAIVRINDVGPLRPGRIIDLNLRTMRHFDPTLKIGVIPSVRVSVLPGRNWVVGPMEYNGGTTPIAQASLAPH